MYVNGDCSIINSKNCNISGQDTTTDHFRADVTYSSPQGKDENWIKIAISNN